MARNSDPLDDLTAKWEPTLRKAFLDAINELTDRVNVNVVGQLLERGDIQGAIRAVGLDPLDFRGLDAAILQAFADGGSQFAQQIPATRSPEGSIIQFRFDARNPSAEDWARNHSSQLITQIIADQRVSVQNYIAGGLEAGRNPRSTALELVGRRNRVTGQRQGGIVGLTSIQSQYVETARAELSSGNAALLKNYLTRNRRDKRFDRTVTKAIRDGQPIPLETVNRMTAQYSDRLLLLRGEVIARNETARTLGQSRTETYQQAINRNHIQQDTITRFWITAGDERVRHTHRLIPGMNKAGRRWDEPFATPTGLSMHAPHDTDVMCRCHERIRINYFAGLK